MHRHWKKCTKKPIQNERMVQQMGRAIENRLHHNASEELVCIFAKFRENEIIRNVRFDWLLICYGNELCLNYSPHYQEGYICNKIRAAAKLLCAAKSISSELSDLSSLFHVKNCNTVIDAIRFMAKFDRQTKLFGSPGTASTTVTLINTIGELLVVEAMKLDDPDKERDADRFIRVFKRDVRTKINKLVAVTKAKNRRNKDENIPTTEDIYKLSKFLDFERHKYFSQLTETFTYPNWLKLAQLTMVSILIYNRRRAGEMQNIAITDFDKRKIIADQCEMLLDAMPENAKRKIKSRMEIRGKLGRTVPVLLKHHWEDCLKLLIRYRTEAGILDANDFMFSVPTQAARIKTINVWTVLRSFSVACGAQNPSSLRGTNLRKHMASFCATKNLTDTDIANLAEFMGHDEKIHRTTYRNNPLTSQVSQMTSLLDAAQGNTNSDDSSDDISDNSEDEIDDESDIDLTDINETHKTTKKTVITKRTINKHRNSSVTTEIKKKQKVDPKRANKKLKASAMTQKMAKKPKTTNKKPKASLATKKISTKRK